jgi:hypothetical protein
MDDLRLHENATVPSFYCYVEGRVGCVESSSLRPFHCKKASSQELEHSRIVAMAYTWTRLAVALSLTVVYCL